MQKINVLTALQAIENILGVKGTLEQSKAAEIDGEEMQVYAFPIDFLVCPYYALELTKGNRLEIYIENEELFYDFSNETDQLLYGQITTEQQSQEFLELLQEITA